MEIIAVIDWSLPLFRLFFVLSDSMRLCVRGSRLQQSCSLLLEQLVRLQQLGAMQQQQKQQQSLLSSQVVKNGTETTVVWKSQLHC